MQKVTLLLTQTSDGGRVGGWSETWYFDGTAAAAFAAANRLAKKRSAFLVHQAAVVGIRTAEVGGGVVAHPVVYPGTQNTKPDIPQMALNCVCKGQGVQNRKFFQLRGIPDSSVDGGKYKPTQGVNAGVVAYFGGLAGDQFRFRAKDLTSPKIGLVSVANDGTFRLNGAAVYNAGSYIQLLRAKNAQGVNVSGDYFVDIKTDDRNGKFLNWTGGVVTLNGQARVVSYVFPVVDGDTLIARDVTTRKVGRPFDQYVGRRSKR